MVGSVVGTTVGTVVGSVVGTTVGTVVGFAGIFTVTLHTAIKLLSSVTAVTVHVPLEIAVTFPLSSTVAIFVSLDNHFTFLFSAVDGTTDAVSCLLSPSRVNVKEPVLSVTPVT